MTLIPVINTSPSVIDTGMTRGSQKIASFTITNVGQETLRNARLEGLSTSWMALTIPREIGDIKPGESRSVGIMLSPPDTLPQGVYDDKIVVYSDNHIPYNYNIQVTVTSNAVGSVFFDVVNEFMEDVPGASITFQHQLLLELTYNLKTGPDGTLMVSDIPEGRYVFNISAPGHVPTSGSFIIEPGMTKVVPMALQVDMVDVEFSVTPVPLEDRYEITVSQTFETNVPAPVLIVEPPKIDLPSLKPGEVFNGEFKVTNYGLVAVFDVELEFPTSIGDYDIEVLREAVPDKLGAMQSVTIPYKITRRLTTAGLSSFEKFLAYRRMPTSPLLNISSILSLIGYIGTPCPGSFAITFKAKCIICPNTIFQRIVNITRVSHYVFFLDFSRDCTPFMSNPTKHYPINYPWHQSGGGSLGGAYSPLGTNNPCNCAKEGTVLPDTNPNDCQHQACRNGEPRTVANNIVFKRKNINKSGDDKYGHWWVEIGDESYGWWPAGPVDLWDTLTGVDGALNGQGYFDGGTPTTDPHHGNDADEVFKPYISVSAPDGYNCEKAVACISDFANSYSGEWSWPVGQNCHSFQEEMMSECYLEK